MENTISATGTNETAEHVKAENVDENADKAATNESAEVKCENGVCQVLWKPTRSAA